MSGRSDSVTTLLISTSVLLLVLLHSCYMGRHAMLSTSVLLISATALLPSTSVLLISATALLFNASAPLISASVVPTGTFVSEI